MTEQIKTILVFKLDEHVYGISAENVTKVIQSVEITDVPRYIGDILGVINYHGVVVPVIDIRKKFGLPIKPLDIEDKIIIIQIKGDYYAWVADLIYDVREYVSSEFSNISERYPELNHLDGIVKYKDGMIVLNDIEYILKAINLTELMEALQQVDI